MIPGEPDQGEICLNRAAMRLAQPGAKVNIISYAQRSEAEMEKYRPVFIFVDEENRITRDHLRAQSP